VGSVRAAIRIAAVLAVAPAMLAAPAAAQANFDLSITSSPSARLVARGQTVNFEFTVANRGTEAAKAVFVNLFSLRGHGLGANNPYISVSPSQGICKDESAATSGYQTWTCELGPLAPGASATIKAAVTVNESMNHIAALLPNPFEGGYQDGDNSNNEAVDRIAVSTPPAVSGSKAIKLKGLPTGCVPGNFTLRASTNASSVKKMSASMELGEGFWQKVVRGRKLVTKVPASRLAVELGKTYTLHIKAKEGGGRKLEKLVVLTPCGA
jgi:hypothetical protein